MTVPPPDPRSGDERPPSWAGAPGFTPGVDDLPPHAPMPGAPPYPAAPEHDPPPVGAPGRRTGFVTALGATAVWAVVNVVVAIAVTGVPAALGRFAVALAVPTVAAALAVWAVARRRAWAFWLLVLLAAPVFWVLRAVFIALPLS